TGMQNALDIAILDHRPNDLESYRKLAELPFDFERRRVSVLVSGPAGVQLVTKGAPESILEVCASIESAGGSVALTPELERQAQATLDGLGRTGYHVLGIAHKSLSDAS